MLYVVVTLKLFGRVKFIVYNKTILTLKTTLVHYFQKL
jgi:hypothetical protein